METEHQGQMESVQVPHRRQWLALASLIAFIAHAWASHGFPTGTAGGGPAQKNASAASTWAIPYTPAELLQYKADVAEMFRHSFNGYMQRAFPKDDLRPLSCRGSNSQGGIAITLLDALDALVVFDDVSSLRTAVDWVTHNATFDVDVRVHVFEVTIRALGGLLSAHALIQLDPSLVPNYDGALLRAAVDLTDRLLPAFDTPTGLPLSWVNLRYGQVAGDTRITCTACAGTLLLEFGVLSRVTGNPVYEDKSRNAVETIWAKRSPRGLVGNTINVDTGEWVRRDAGVGAGVDSFYEYLLKAYLAFGEPAYLDMFAEAYGAAQASMALSPSVNGVSWLVDVHMGTGRVMSHYMSSLAAFWPGMQAVVGQVEEAEGLHENWTSAWSAFKWLPDSFHLNMKTAHGTMNAYPLRPEMLESTFMLYAATKKPYLLRFAAGVVEKIRDATRGPCGHASVGDVASGRLEDTMESFFLSETAKYAYFLFSNATAIIDHFVLSTEGHLIPPFRPETAAAAAAEAAGAAALAPPPGADSDIDKRCAALCATGRARRGLAAGLRQALPRVPVDGRAALQLRQRRCSACRAVARATGEAKKKADWLWRDRADTPQRAGKLHVAPPQWALSRTKGEGAPKVAVLCLLQRASRGKLTCSYMKLVPLAELSSQAIQSMPNNVIFFQISNATAALPDPEALAPGIVEVEITGAANERRNSEESGAEEGTGGGSLRLPAMLAEFGPDLLPGCDSVAPASIEAALQRWGKMLRQQEEEARLDDEDPSDDGETEEEVRERIAAVARRQKEAAAQRSAQQQHGQLGAEEYAEEDDDDDPYVDPDDLEDDDEEEEEVAGKERSCKSGSSDSAAVKAAAMAKVVLPFIFPDPASRSASSSPAAAMTAEAGAAALGSVGAVCDVTGRLAVASPTDGCLPFTNWEAVRGGIAVISRGNCSFLTKIRAAELAGAIGAVVINTAADQSLMPMGLDEESQGKDLASILHPRITSVMVREIDAAVVKAAAERGATARLRDPPQEMKLNLAAQVVERFAAKLREQELRSIAAAAKGAAGGAAKGPLGATAAAGETDTPTFEGLGGREGSGSEQGVCPTLLEPEKSGEERRVGLPPKEEGVTLPARQAVQLEAVIPAVSQMWVMQQIYQQQQDLTPALQQAAELLIDKQ